MDSEENYIPAFNSSMSPCPACPHWLQVPSDQFYFANCHSNHAFIFPSLAILFKFCPWFQNNQWLFIHQTCHQPIGHRDRERWERRQGYSSLIFTCDTKPMGFTRSVIKGMVALKQLQLFQISFPQESRGLSFCKRDYLSCLDSIILFVHSPISPN